MRGAERTFVAMAECWPSAPLYTLLHDPSFAPPEFADRDVHASYLQQLRIRQRGFRRLLPLFPRAAERVPIGDYDLVISSSSAFAHGVRPREGAVHVCYCHSPFRYVWHERDRGLAEVPGVLQPFLNRMLDRLKLWDLEASERVTHYVANSEITRQRIGEIYGREAEVLHPPVDVSRFAPAEPEDFFLLVSEFVPHKQVGLALAAAREAGRLLKVVGAGPEARRLVAAYHDTAEFLGRVSDADLADLLARARALVVPSVEEFGIAAVESQAAGRPVVAAGAGGALETVIPGETGVLVPPGDTHALAEALHYTDFSTFDPGRARHNAERFSIERFHSRLKVIVDAAVIAGTSPTSGRLVPGPYVAAPYDASGSAA